MTNIIIISILFILMLIYFKIADKYNIIDKPNHRSAHTEITLRGGGIIYPLSFIIFGIVEAYRGTLIQPTNFLIFGVGLLLICGISFLDDIVDLSSKVRVVFHFVAVTLLLYFLNAFSLLPFWAIPLLYILIIGILNAYNFMDGINGMSGLYSLVILGSLLYVNQNIIEFVNKDFITYPLMASVVFLFFNFRKKAKCFMGDVGSIGIAFWVIALLGLLIAKTNDFKYIFFLSVYGIEVIFTILERLKLKENIFEAHRRHLYQLLVNELGISHLKVSVLYSIVQLIVNLVVIFTVGTILYVSLVLLLLFVSLLYWYFKMRFKKKYNL